MKAGRESSPKKEDQILLAQMLANKRDVPYQSLLKVFLAERIREELTVERASKKTSAGKRTG